MDLIARTDGPPVRRALGFEHMVTASGRRPMSSCQNTESHVTGRDRSEST
jgi:hypothetical protein